MAVMTLARPNETLLQKDEERCSVFFKLVNGKVRTE